MTDRHSLRHDLDGATPEEQAIHLALQREVEVDLTGYATQKWVKAQGYLTSVPDLGGSPGQPGEPIDIDLDGYATTEYVDAKAQGVEDASVVRDELLSNKIEDEVKGNTAAHIVLNEDIRNLSEVKYNKSGGPVTGPMTIRTPYGGNTRQLIVEAPDLGEQKAAFSVNGDGDVKAGYDANHPFLASARNDVVTKACLDQSVEGEADDRAKGDEALHTEILGLQDAFDAAIIAGQEGAENINLELQSYLKKDEANTSFLKLTGGTMTGALTINRGSNETLIVKKDGTWKLKIWADGTVDTTKTSFSAGHLVSRSFTDSQYLKLTGGELTGNLLSNALFKTTRNEGYAFQCRPDNGDTSVFIHTSGHIEASGYIKVDDKKVSLEDHTHSGYAAENHTHSDIPAHNHDTKYVKGNWTISKSGGNWYIS